MLYELTYIGIGHIQRRMSCKKSKLGELVTFDVGRLSTVCEQVYSKFPSFLTIPIVIVHNRVHFPDTLRVTLALTMDVDVY